MIENVVARPGLLVAFRLAPTIGAALLLAITSATAPLPPLARGIAIGFLIASVLVAFIPRREDVRTHASVTMAIVAVAATGFTKTGLPYEIGCGLFAAVALVSLRAPLTAKRMRHARERAAQPGALASAPGGVDAPTSPRWPAVALIALVGAAVTTALLFALPPASAYAERQAQKYGGNVVREPDQVGFATTLRIGSLNDILKSDRVVMRVQGENVSYLRGVVLDRYEARIWTSTQAKGARTSIPARSAEATTTTRIELSRAALSSRAVAPRWFLPEDACDVHTPSGRMDVDLHGTAHPDPPENAREVSFRRASTSTCTTPLPERGGPTPSDTALAARIIVELRPIAREWTKGTASTRAALEALMLHLESYGYSLENRREGSTDPVVAFLRVHKRGHCELFASAMALLARSIGIPTRIAVGYRVDEVNPITGLTVVRDRNAHSWVEAWVDDRWESFDPTPLAELHASTRPSHWDNVSEALSLGWDRTATFFGRLTLLELGLFSGGVAGVLLVVRWLTQRRRRTRGSSMNAASRPLPAFETLATALARAGWVRTASEPLEHFARRIDGAGQPWAAEVSEALVRYAELRYGGIGEESRVAQLLDELARRVTPSS